MAERTGSVAQEEERQQRLRAALRDNLLRRKAQARARAGAGRASDSGRDRYSGSDGANERVHAGAAGGTEHQNADQHADRRVIHDSARIGTEKHDL
jgi:hypothetical protein